MLFVNGVVISRVLLKMNAPPPHPAVLQVICKDMEGKPDEEKKEPEETSVSVQLFDSPPMNISVPGDIPWTDPKFSEVVAQEALDRYKETTM